MRYLALATDYDGTIARDGVLDELTLGSLRALRDSGRKLLLVTGRELDDLLAVCPRVGAFDLVVAENGALVYDPATGAARTLAEPPPAEFAARLRAEGLPVSAGRVIVATWVPHEHAVLSAIRDLGLAWQVIFNKNAVMALPAGVSKASGLRAALAELGIAPERVVGVGDAENDLAFLAVCGLAVAVANALPAVMERADVTTAGARGEGVIELVGRLLGDEYAGLGRG